MEVGAPQQRKRLFLLAYRDDGRHSDRQLAKLAADRGLDAQRLVAGGGGKVRGEGKRGTSVVPDADREREQQSSRSLGDVGRRSGNRGAADQRVVGNLTRIPERESGNTRLRTPTSERVEGESSHGEDADERVSRASRSESDVGLSHAELGGFEAERNVREGEPDAAGDGEELDVSPCPDGDGRWHVGDGWDLCVDEAGLAEVQRRHREQDFTFTVDERAVWGRVGEPTRIDHALDADTERESGEGRRSTSGPSEGVRYERPSWPPRPDDSDGWSYVLAHDPVLAPALPAERPLRGVADGSPDRMDEQDISWADRLSALGNMVLPLTAALAISVLRARYDPGLDVGAEDQVEEVAR